MAGTKRKATTQAEPLSSPSRRQSARAKKVQVVYAESDAEDVASDDEFDEAGNKSQSESEAELDEPSEDEQDSDADSEVEAKKKGRGNNKAKGTGKGKAKESGLNGWKKIIGSNGVEQMVIDIPGKKDPGDTPYADGRIHPNTLEFLMELKRNNKREWLKFHDAPFRQAEKDFQTFVAEVSNIICKIDSTIPDLPVKDIIYRIHRDMRFTPDPTPYKPYFSVSWSRTGRKGPYAHYYLHIQPGEESFCGGGYFGCDSETLACMREDIDTQPHQFKSILMGEKLRKTFFPAVKKDEGKIVAAFCNMSNMNALKKKPKDFAADHKDIELLKLRNFILRKKISDKDVTSKNFLNLVGNIAEGMEPFITYLNNTVMPDPDSD
ncbi:hypothetical protein ONS95_010736 [Cadophora gregata]|uniref:uncharacterized protein n=1 Tax=Cadophora gregata TaxID=51156 RepID=UPI0026DD614D|nr:uncharacterized protein ONS95_010736 [Cadophora gregata]KAK0122508.1 hypothetical protein ONS95_010736 [Cadophora gregata]KAK0127987.1 hypothetical protein ONS96_007480 [Cadophora gregata f. sp. sojae]